MTAETTTEQGGCGSPNNDESVEEFMQRHQEKEQRGRSDIAMKDLRHIIPLLVMQCFGIKDEPGQKKVKGMWTERPNGWPSDVPYCDPNNATKGESKPKKEKLMAMFNYLTHQYWVLKGVMTPSTIMPVERVTPPSHVSSHTYSLPTSHAHTLTPSPSSSSPSLPPDMKSYTSIHNSPMNDIQMGYTQDVPNPGDEIMQRICHKVTYVERQRLVSDRDAALLHIIQDLLQKMAPLRDRQLELFYTSAHEFECTLDLVSELRHMPSDYRTKWAEFEVLMAGVNQEVAQEVEVVSTETPLSSMGLDNQSFSDLGIKTLTIGTMNDLNANGTLEVRISSETLTAVPRQGERDRKEEQGPCMFEEEEEENQENKEKSLETSWEVSKIDEVHTSEILGKIILKSEENLSPTGQLIDTRITDAVKNLNLKTLPGIEKPRVIIIHEPLMRDEEVMGSVPTVDKITTHEEGFSPTKTSSMDSTVQVQKIENPSFENNSQRMVENAVALPWNPMEDTAGENQELFQGTEDLGEERITVVGLEGEVEGESLGDKSITNQEPVVMVLPINISHPVGQELQGAQMIDAGLDARVDNNTAVQPVTTQYTVVSEDAFVRSHSGSIIQENQAESIASIEGLNEEVTDYSGKNEESTIQEEKVTIELSVPHLISILKDHTHPGYKALTQSLQGNPYFEQILKMNTTGGLLSSVVPLPMEQEQTKQDPPVAIQEVGIPTVVSDFEMKYKDESPTKKRKRKR